MVSKRLTWSSRSFSGQDIAVDALNRVHIVFTDVLVGNSDLFYKRSTDGGTTWEPLKRMTWIPGFKQTACVEFDSFNNIYIVWSDSTPGNAELFLKRSKDGGSSWGTTNRLTWSPNDSISPSLVSQANNRLHLTWEERLSDDYEIFYKRSNLIVIK